MSALGHGQLWWADLDQVRPVVVLTRQRVATRLARVVVAPVTTTARGLATEVDLGSAEGVRDGSVASLDTCSWSRSASCAGVPVGGARALA